MNEPPSSEEAIFSHAVDLPPAERSAYLDQACGDDGALRARLAALLHSHEEAGNLLDAAPGGEVRTALSKPTFPDEKPGSLIGRYKLLQKIGEGGCGVVYMAEQQEPVVRRVALKVIKLGMDTREVIARFEAERQALAMMDHPNIAKVFDAGATDSGRPFFVMELVRGIKITDYCDQQNLATVERLNLFTSVCHAIQHAHQKGIIHRDIKPSNILVTLQDGAPMPKVIDFGIAKATQGRLTDQTFFTAFEQFIGTPAYMSPEQAEMSSSDVDTRSDIYSLGVLLYELLMGRTPFETKELLKVGLDEMRRVIREVEPPRPSTRLSTLTDADRATVAKLRGLAPAQLSTLLRGDLDWIVMRCLEKNRVRRYATTDELARDLERHLHDEPVTACPPSALYRFQKLIRRNKLAVATTVAIATVLILGTVISLWQAQRAIAAEREAKAMAAEAQIQSKAAQAASAKAEADRARALVAEEQQRQLRQQAEAARTGEARQRAVAEAARDQEARQRDQAESERKKAETEAGKSRQVAQFLQDMLQGVGPSVALGRDTKMLREILDKTVARLGTDLKGQPEVEAELRQIIGNLYRELGEYEKAEAMQRATLLLRHDLYGPEHVTVATSLGNLAGILSSRGDLVGAEAMQREALAMQRKLLGNEQPAVATSLSDLGNVLRARGDLTGAEAVQREALALQRKLHGDAHPAVAASLHNLAQTLAQRGDLDGAETMQREALAMQRQLLGPEHPAVATSLDSLALMLVQRGDRAGAEALYREALVLHRKILGDEHPDVAISLGNLATVLRDRGDLNGAETMLREALAMQRKLLGDAHPAVAISLGNLATLQMQHSDWEAAETLWREALAINRTTLGNEHPNTVASLHSLAGVLLARDDYAGAEPLLREALEIQRTLLDQDHPEVALSLDSLAGILSSRGDLIGAEEAVREALAIRRKLPGDATAQIIKSLGDLAVIRQKRYDYAGAEPLYREVLTLLRGLPGSKQPDLVEALNDLGGVLFKLDDLAGAETQLLEAWKIGEADPTVPPKVRFVTADLLEQLYRRWTKTDPRKFFASGKWRGNKRNQEQKAKTYLDAVNSTPKPPDVIVNLSVALQSIEFKLPRVVVLQNIGPLGYQNFWDEYVVSITNHGEMPITVGSVVLTGQEGQSVIPGADPWVLANRSKPWWEKTDAKGATSVGKVGTGAVMTGAGGSAFFMLQVGVWSSAAFGVGAAIIIPVYVIKSYQFNAKGRKAVETEFKQRRLALPAIIAPGQSVEGSFFFPVTPGPQRLALQCRVADRIQDVTLALRPLASLHRKNSSKDNRSKPSPLAIPASAAPAATPMAPAESSSHSAQSSVSPISTP